MQIRILRIKMQQKNKKERVGRILQMHANKREELDIVYSGDIAAAVGFKSTTTGDTICDEQHPVILESMEFPEPVIDVAIEPKTKGDQGKMAEALAKLAEEDPTFRAHTDHETGQTIISGMGELHLEIIVDRLLREFKVEANVGAPQVAYKETLQKPLTLTANTLNSLVVVVSMVTVKFTLSQWMPMEKNCSNSNLQLLVDLFLKNTSQQLEKVSKKQRQSGILGGFPVLGVKATVYDGSYHDVDSSEMAFHIAGSMAF